MRIITTASASAYDQWWDRAINDPSVWPYLSLQRYSGKAKIDDTDWDGNRFIDATGNGILDYTPTRSDGLRSAVVSVWVLDVPNRPLIALGMLAELPTIVRRSGTEWLRSSIHESNAKSRKLVERMFGAPWGRQPGGAWNGLTGEYEVALHYQTRADDLAFRIGAARKMAA